MKLNFFKGKKTLKLLKAILFHLKNSLNKVEQKFTKLN